MSYKETSTMTTESLSNTPDLEEGENEQSEGSVRVVSGSGFRYVVPFPWRLHQMLEEIEKAGDSSIVSWLPDGLRFQVHNPTKFVEKVIPKFFKQKSYKSFQRQLHLYGFHRETDGVYRGSYFHESFIRSNRQQALEISRIKAPKRRRTPPQKPALKQKQEMGNSRLSALQRFQPLDPKQLPRGPIRSIKPVALSNTNFDPVTAFQQSCSCPHSKCQGPHVCRQTPKQTSPLSESAGSRDGAVAETYSWLINAGVPFSAFDPVSIKESPSLGCNDLYDCAEEITSLFTDISSKIPDLLVLSELSPPEPLDSPVNPSSVFNEDASLLFPEEMLGDLKSAIWDL